MNTDALCSEVQHNCNIVDAKHAGSFTLCTYLMKMREYCRWDKGYSCSDVMSKEEVGDWVTERESLWDEIEQYSFQPIQIGDNKFDPFDTDTINASLLPKGMVYSGGIGAKSIPHFFLAKLDATHSFDGYQVVISAEECARDLSAPPAMTLQNNIFIRKESVKRMLWEKVQEAQWNNLENAMSKAISYYDFKGDIDFALDQMTEVEVKSIILHERGEIEASKEFNDQWKELLATVTNSRLELMLRGVKDFYADSLTTLPALIDQSRIPSLHFYAGNMSAMRKEICPSFMKVYKDWCRDDDAEQFRQWVSKSKLHWQKIMSEILMMREQNQKEMDIEEFIQRNYL